MSQARAARVPVQGARAALGLLTILPVGAVPVDPAARRAAPGWFPVVGGLIAAAPAGIWVLIEPRLGSAYASVLALAVSALLAGGLHHDGLADTADGLGVRGNPERRLEAMRDPRLGAFGALALLIYMLLSVTALAQLSPARAAAALVCGHALGRWSALAQLALLPPARPDGLGAAYGAAAPAVAIGSGFAIAIALAAAGLGAGAVGLAGMIAATAVTSAMTKRSFAGRTGDTLGAGVLTTEVVVYSALAAYWAS